MKQKLKKRVLAVVSATSLLTLGAVPLATAHSGSSIWSSSSGSASAGVLSQSSGNWIKQYGMSFATAKSSQTWATAAAQNVTGQSGISTHYTTWYRHHYGNDLIDVDADVDVLGGELLDANVDAEVLDGGLLDLDTDVDVLEGHSHHRGHHHDWLLDLDLDLDLL